MPSASRSCKACCGKATPGMPEPAGTSMQSSAWFHVRVTGCALALVLALAPFDAARATEIQVESPSFTFDSENRIYHYQEAKLRFKDITLEALEVQLFADTGEVKAKGNVRLREKTLFISAERADFN